jgi:5'(3')-deoxyribonucleotidase
MSKKILYLDMDGVVADFDKKLHELKEPSDILDSVKVDEIVARNPMIFFCDLEPYDGAIEAVNKLFDLYEVYFLSTPMWDIPESFMAKRIWLDKHFGLSAKKRLILSHRKDLSIGDFLVDDRLKNGAAEFKGTHIHFATEEFPNWQVTLDYLEKNA